MSKMKTHVARDPKKHGRNDTTIIPTIPAIVRVRVRVRVRVSVMFGIMCLQKYFWILVHKWLIL